jgi:DNA gyrase subunit A
MQKTIISDLENIQKNFSHPRKTQIMQAQEIDKIEEKVVERDVVVLVDRFGYLKMLEAGYYKKNQNNMDKEYKHCIYTTNLSRLQIFTDIGKVHQISLEKLPYMKLKDKGIPIDNLSNYDSSREHFLYIRAMTQTESTQLLFVSASGWMKRVEALEYDTSYKTVMSMKLHPEDSLIYVGEASSPQLLLKTQKGYYLRFLTEEIELLHKNHFGKIGMELIAGDAIEWARSIDPQVDKTVDLPSGNVLEIKRVKLRKKGSKGMKLRL